MGDNIWITALRVRIGSFATELFKGHDNILHAADWNICSNFMFSIFIKSVTLFVHITNILLPKRCLQQFLFINGIKLSLTFRIHSEQMSPVLPFLMLSWISGKINGINITCLEQI